MDRDEVTPGDLLKAARGEMTQAEVCRAGNLSASVVCDVEAGRRSVTPRILAAYESALGRRLRAIRRVLAAADVMAAGDRWGVVVVDWLDQMRDLYLPSGVELDDGGEA